MSLGRAWTRQLLEASGAALLAPGAILASLMVLALSGGFGQIGALGEAFVGPSIPNLPGPARLISAPATRKTSPVLVALAAPAIGGAVGVSGHGIGPTMIAPGGQATRRGIPGAGGPHGAGTPPGGLGGRPGAGNPGGGGSQPPPRNPPPTPQPLPTVVDGVVAAGASVTKQVPGPVGAIATQTLESAGHTLDGILSPSKGTAPGGVLSQLKTP
jgi:hypothetical protein